MTDQDRRYHNVVMLSESPLVFLVDTSMHTGAGRIKVQKHFASLLEGIKEVKEKYKDKRFFLMPGSATAYAYNEGVCVSSFLIIEAGVGFFPMQNQLLFQPKTENSGPQTSNDDAATAAAIAILCAV